jgi:hypothetical protein
LKISGIGKYPFVNATEDKLKFDSLTVGQTGEKKVELRNYSQVRAVFTFEKINDDGTDLSFSLSETTGIIEPGSSRKITVRFKPTQSGAYSCTQYNINILGGNTLKLIVSGEALGMDVCLSTKSIHFGEV